MKTISKGLLALLLVAGPPAAAQTISAAEIKAIVASPERSAADRTNDLRRKPEQMLEFIGLRPGMVALDLSAAGGYTTELLARGIGPSGKVYGQSRPRPAQPATPPPAPEGNSNPNLPPVAAPAGPSRPSPEALANRDKLLKEAGVKAAPIEAVVRPFEDAVPPGLADAKLDLVTLMFNYHDLGHLGVDRAAMNQAVFKALKPGGIYVCLDINCSDKLEENVGPLGAFFHGASVMYCMTTSLANDGEGLGTLGLHPHKLDELAAEAGFTDVWLAPLENPFNNLYALRA